MTIAKRLQRQADTCAQLAATTYDEESRERYLRLEQLYRHMLATDGEAEVHFAGTLKSESTERRLS